MTRKIMLLAASAGSVSLFFACAGSDKNIPVKNSVPDILIANIDSTVKPGDDFFQYANGRWLKNNPIPASESGWGIGNLVDDEINAKIKKINIDAAAANAAKGTETQKIGDFWTMAMDSASCDAKGIDPMKAELAQIDGLKDSKDVIDETFTLHPIGVGALYSFYIGQDEKNSNVMAIHLSQGGLGLPNREYYTKTDTSSQRILKAYEKHIASLLQVSGNDEATAKKSATSILAFETALAKASRRREELRVPEKNYNKMTLDEVNKKLTPLIDWKTKLASYGLKNADTAIVGQPEFFTALNGLLQSTSVDVLKAYLRYHLLRDYSDYLGNKVDDNVFAFYGTELSGQKKQRVRWKRVMDSEQQAMGMVLGKLFVKEYFNEKAKKRYADMVEAIRTAYINRIQKLSWMSDSTKAKAIDKLRSMTKKVGYPDKWKDYSTLEIGRTSYCENMKSASRWQFYDMISKFGKPVDRTEWDMNPQEYNAYYNPSNNEIVLPAAIFTIPGVPDSLADDALVYGYAAASTIGHEITHGFDDEGRLYDKYGNLKSWWTAQDSAEFVKRAQVLANQFDKYEPLPGEHISGQATLGENLADLGGIELGIDAFKLTDQYKKGEKINGLTPMQRYFLGYALGWLGAYQPATLHKRLLSDVHSPGKWRVNGPFSDVPEFYEAFGIKEGSPMYVKPEDRVSVW